MLKDQLKEGQGGTGRGGLTVYGEPLLYKKSCKNRKRQVIKLTE